MKISLILEAINHWTGPVDAARSAVTKLGKSVRTAGEHIMYMRDRTIDATHHFRKLVGEEGLARANRSLSYFRNQLSGVSGAFTLMKYASAAAVIGLGEEFVRGVFAAGGAAQQMLVTLTRLEGSATKAKQAMSWMQNFAMGPGASMSMPDIMRSYQMAKNFGMNPQGGSLSAFADLAAGERVPLQKVLYAIKDAMEGTSTRPMANLGIKMHQGKKAGDPNTYTYADVAGKWVTTSSAKTPEATLEMLTKIINSKYAGLATQQAKTVPGGIEQLKKLLYMFEMKVADSGVMDWALKRLNQFFAWVRGAAADGSLDKLAKKIADFMTTTGDQIIAFVTVTNWEAVGKDLKLFGAGLLMIFGAIKALGALGGGGISGLLNIFVVSKIIGITGALMGLVPVIVALATVLFGLELAAAPIELCIAAVGALAACAYLIWANWGHLGSWLKGFWNFLPGWAKVALVAFFPLIGVPLLIMNNWDKLVGFFKGLGARIKAAFQSGDLLKYLGAGAAVATGQYGLAAGILMGPSAAKPAPTNAGANPAPASAHHIVITFGKNGQPDVISHGGDHTLQIRRGQTGGVN